MATLTIKGAMDNKYASLKRNLDNQMVHGLDQYSTTCSQAKTLLSKYVPDKPSNPTLPPDI